MAGLLTNSGLVTKVRGMNAKLITDEQYEEIASLHNVTEIATYLKEKTSYSSILQALVDAQLHRGDIEKVLIISLYDDYTRLFKFADLSARKFLKLYLMEFEVDLINYCFRIVINHYNEPFDLYYKKEFFDHFSHISIDKLITSRTTDELVENLKGTPYYEPLSTLKTKEGVTLFDYDLTMNLFFLSLIWKKRSGIIGLEDKNIFVKEWGTIIDMLNLEWIYRAKKYYQLTPEETFSIIVPMQYRISSDLFMELVQADNVEDFNASLQKTIYASLFDPKAEFEFERLYAKVLDQMFQTNRRRNPNSIAVVNEYLHKKEAEIHKLTTIIECVRYGLSTKETLNYIGGKINDR